MGSRCRGPAIGAWPARKPAKHGDIAGRSGHEGLRAENARLHERVHEVVQERDYLRALAGSLAQGQRLMLEARPRRRWRWPWQRRERTPRGASQKDHTYVLQTSFVLEPLC